MVQIQQPQILDGQILSTAPATIFAQNNAWQGIQTFDKPIQQSIGGSNTNAALGTNALNTTTTGTYNTAVGYYVLFSNTNGSQNTAYGAGALSSNTTGSANTVMGFGASDSNTTGTGNTAIGNSALGANTKGSYNIAVGFNALPAYNDAAGNQDYNVVIGYNSATAYSGTEMNNVVIGSNIAGVGGESNMVRIGSQIYGLQEGKPQYDYLHIDGTMQASAWQTTQSAAVAPTVITVGASPYTYTNTSGQNLILYVSGGAVTAVSLSGVTTGLTSGTFYLGPNDTLEITYSTAPTMLSKAL